MTDRSDERFWRDRPVLVTGGTGLLGAWVVRRLLDHRADVVCLVRDWVPQSELVQSRMVEKVQVVRGDVRDQAVMERALGEYEVVTVFHLAAQPIVPIANRNAVATFETNVAGTWALLEACRRTKTIGQVVLASSDKAYGDQPVLPYTEDMSLDARHPYDVSKACADLIARSYATAFDVPVTTTRCGNLYGGGDLNWNRIIPGTIRSVLRGERPVVRSDGKFVRDYFYVEDAAAAYMQLAERMAGDGGLAGEAFNFSNETPVAVLDLVGRLLGQMGSDLAPDVRNEANNEIREQYLDAGKARQRLGWKPLFSLEEGLRRTAAWYQDFLGGRS